MNDPYSRALKYPSGGPTANRPADGKTSPPAAAPIPSAYEGEGNFMEADNRPAGGKARRKRRQAAVFPQKRISPTNKAREAGIPERYCENSTGRLRRRPTSLRETVLGRKSVDVA